VANKVKIQFFSRDSNAISQ